LKWPRTFRGQLAARWLSLVWVFRTPPWAKNDLKMRHLIRNMRILVALGNLGVMAAFFIALFVAAHADQQAHDGR
jgi:hypothetical protein